jgi:hypothetical protein
MNISSAIGRSPVDAAPTAAPIKAPAKLLNQALGDAQVTAPRVLALFLQVSARAACHILAHQDHSGISTHF